MKRGPKMMALGDPRGSCGIFVCCDEKRESKAKLKQIETQV